MERVIFVIVALFLLGIELTITYYKPSWISGTIFVISLFGFIGFYLFQYGALETFSLEALKTKAKFIKQKAQEVEKDSDAIKELRKKNEEFTASIGRILDDLEKSQSEINEYKSKLIALRDELVRVKMGLVEMNYLQYVGRGKFPNPFHERILAKLNELLELAVPDPEQRARFVKELDQYTKDKLK